HVGSEGLVVRASRWVTVRDIEDTLRENAAWILRRLAEWRERRRDVLPAVWTSGAPLLFQGRAPARATRAAPQRPITADLVNATIRHRAPDDEEALATAVARWLRDQAI